MLNFSINIQRKENKLSFFNKLKLTYYRLKTNFLKGRVLYITLQANFNLYKTYFSFIEKHGYRKTFKEELVFNLV